MDAYIKCNILLENCERVTLIRPHTNWVETPTGLDSKNCTARKPKVVDYSRATILFLPNSIAYRTKSLETKKCNICISNVHIKCYNITGKLCTRFSYKMLRGKRQRHERLQNKSVTKREICDFKKYT